MTDSLILFNAPMVRAILREIENPGMGKTQTRRVIKNVQNNNRIVLEPASQEAPARVTHVQDAIKHRVLPHAVGDRLWVQEEFYLTDDGENESVVYTAHEDDVTEHIGTIAGIKHQLQLSDEWAKSHLEVHPPKKMPRWASRLTLEVTDVRIERLQDISEKDAKAEGCRDVEFYPDDGYPLCVGHTFYEGERVGLWNTRKKAFQDLWDGIYGKRAGCAWGDNPWVVAYTFKPFLCNIDQMGGE